MKLFVYQNFMKINSLLSKSVYFFTICRNDIKRKKKGKRKEGEEKRGEWSAGQEREEKMYNIYSILNMQ